jgi:hypothetical protein
MRYSYSIDIVYNNFPWPSRSREAASRDDSVEGGIVGYLTDKLYADIEAAAQAILDARALFPDSSLADLYDPNLMPPELAKAHAKLDRLVEKAYGKSFDTDAERVAFLFERYQALTADLFTESGAKKKRAKKRGEEA